MEISGALKVNLETIRSYIALDVAGDKGNRDASIIREACGNVYHFIMNKQEGLEPSCRDPGKTYMSETFHEQFKKEPNAKVIKEHLVPMKCIKMALRGMTDLTKIYEELEKNMKVVWITLEEDILLNKLYRDSIPSNGNTRHEEVGIKHHPRLVKFKNPQLKKNLIGF